MQQPQADPRDVRTRDTYRLTARITLDVPRDGDVRDEGAADTRRVPASDLNVWLKNGDGASLPGVTTADGTVTFTFGSWFPLVSASGEGPQLLLRARKSEEDIALFDARQPGVVSGEETRGPSVGVDLKVPITSFEPIPAQKRADAGPRPATPGVADAVTLDWTVGGEPARLFALLAKQIAFDRAMKAALGPEGVAVALPPMSVVVGTKGTYTDSFNHVIGLTDFDSHNQHAFMHEAWHRFSDAVVSKPARLAAYHDSEWSPIDPRTALEEGVANAVASWWNGRSRVQLAPEHPGFDVENMPLTKDQMGPNSEGSVTKIIYDLLDAGSAGNGDDDGIALGAKMVRILTVDQKAHGKFQTIETVLEATRAAAADLGISRDEIDRIARSAGIDPTISSEAMYRPVPVDGGAIEGQILAGNNPGPEHFYRSVIPPSGALRIDVTTSDVIPGTTQPMPLQITLPNDTRDLIAMRSRNAVLRGQPGTAVYFSVDNRLTTNADAQQAAQTRFTVACVAVPTDGQQGNPLAK